MSTDYRRMFHAVVRAYLPPNVDEITEESILPSGSLEVPPELRPFVVVRVLDRLPEVKPGFAHSQQVEVWAHDTPGSYVTIDRIHRTLRELLVASDTGCVPWPANNPETAAPWAAEFGFANAIGIRHNGESRDLADDYYGTITRYSSWTLVGSDS